MKRAAYLLVLFLLLGSTAFAAPSSLAAVQSGTGSVSLAWDDDINPPATTKYYIYHSTTSGSYSASDRRDAGSAKTFIWTGLAIGRHYFVASAYTTTTPVLESGYSNEVNLTIAAPLTLVCPTVTTGKVGTAISTSLTAAGDRLPIRSRLRRDRFLRDYH